MEPCFHHVPLTKALVRKIWVRLGLLGDLFGHVFVLAKTFRYTLKNCGVQVQILSGEHRQGGGNKDGYQLAVLHPSRYASILVV